MIITSKKNLFNTDLDLFGKLNKKINNNDLAILFRQIFFMLDAGISISDTIDILSEQKKNKNLDIILKDVYNNILEGQKLSFCLSKHNKYFPSLVINMIKSGENTGNLNQISYDLANYYERQAKFISDLLRVLIYPVIILIMSLLVLILALVFVIPNYSQMFSYEDLPFMTKFVIDLSEFFCKYYLWLVLFLLIFFLVAKNFFKTNQGKMFYGRFIFLSPVKNVYRPYLNFMFSQILSMLLNSNIDIISALENVKQVINNKFLDKDFDLIINKIRTGHKISDAIAESKKFDQILIEMINVGENSGNLGKIMLHCQKYFENQFLFNMKKFESLIEPTLTIFIGIILAVIMLAIMEPNFSLGNIL